MSCRQRTLKMFLIAAALNFSPLALAASPAANLAANAPVATDPIKGKWFTGNSSHRYAFEVHFAFAQKIDGYILWTLEESPVPSERDKIGLQAKEFVRGTFDAKTRVVKLKGYRRNDKYGIIGLDEYKLTLSADGKHLYGKTKAEYNSWAGRMETREQQIDILEAGRSKLVK
jgi:hypothetical protein